MDQKSSMASPLILVVTCWALLVSPALSLTCSSQKLTAGNKRPFESCLDLPVLDSYLHYTYDAANSSLSVAFVAAPAKSDGWIAWAINPTATGMIGSQALIAFKSNGGAPVVKTYNISSYRDIKEGKLSFEVWNLRAENFDGGKKLAIFASVKVPAAAEKVNQVWQIGGKVTNGRPEAHAFNPPNLSSKNVLRFAGADSPSPTPAPSAGSEGSNGEKSAGRAARRSVAAGVNLGILVLLGSVIIF